MRLSSYPTDEELTSDRSVRIVKGGMTAFTMTPSAREAVALTIPASGWG
jgi:hypothetical protein